MNTQPNQVSGDNIPVERKVIDMATASSRMSASDTATASVEAPIRADARHNRDRIVSVSRELFAQRGLDVPMTTIARRAGVGVATLYRRFPSKESLVTVAFEEQFVNCTTSLNEALADPDPWRGFSSVIEDVCAMQATDRGFSVAVIGNFPGLPDIQDHQQQLLDSFRQLTRRAQAAGVLRTDFVADDLAIFLTANAGVVSQTGDAAHAASRRLVAFFLDSLRTDRSDPPRLPPPVRLDLLSVLAPS